MLPLGQLEELGHLSLGRDVCQHGGVGENTVVQG